MQQATQQQWQRVQDRTPGNDFLVGVKTTGIFCRLGCPARTPKRENMVIFDAVREAVDAGFRPCLKCRPLGAEPKVVLVSKVARAIEEDPTAPWDGDELADVAGISSRALRQQFLSVLGVSPRAFRDAVRLRTFKSSLKEGNSVTHASYDAGYSSPARRHEAVKDMGMTPSSYAKGAEGEVIGYTVLSTTLGNILMAATQKGVCNLHFLRDGEQPETYLQNEFSKAEIVPAQADDRLLGWASQVADFLKKGGPRPDVPVDLRGTAFQMKVWQALQEIPTGTTTTYGALAKKLGNPGASRAVGSANGKNPVAIIVPCHLVLATGGKLGGYAYGLDAKRKLLELEVGKADLFTEK